MTTDRVVRRACFVALVSTTVLISTGCWTPPPPPGATCPFAANTIQLNGDSNGTQLPQYLDVAGHVVFNGAQGGAAFSVDTGVPTIGSRVRQYLTDCGRPAAIVIEGSTNDFSHQRTSEQIVDAVSELDQFLVSQDLTVVWTTMHPVPNNGSWTPAMLDARTEYNAWLTTPGNVSGTVVDVTAALDAEADPGWLDPAYYEIVDVLGNPDPLHVNQAGYQAWADALEDPLALALG